MIDQELSPQWVGRKALIEDALQRLLPPADAEPRRVHEAMRYATLDGGKRLRPLLTLSTAEALGENADSVTEAACAIELVHAASLIFDDLPAMDNSHARRGKPATHIQFGEATAILAGIGLIALAYDLIASNAGRMCAHQTGAVVRLLSSAIGTSGIIYGQDADLAPAGAPASSEADAMARHKSAALFLLAISVSARLCAASEEQRSALQDYAGKLGFAFQMTDDLLDIDQDAAGVRPVQAYRDEGEAAARQAARLIAEAEEALRTFGARAQPLIELASYVRARLR